MVWQETRTTAIVIMLTQTFENDTMKYFPSNPDIPTVSYVDTESGDQFTAIVSDRAIHDWEPQGVLSTMQLDVHRKSESQPRPNESQADEEPSAVKSKKILHYQFIAWPNFGLPEDGDRKALIDLSGASRLAEVVRDGSPRIVHCVSGSGRTGTFIALDFLLGEIEDGAMEDSDVQTDMIFDTVDSLMRQRMLIFQDFHYYEFLYKVIKEDLTRKLAYDARKSFLARWPRVLISASVRRFDCENGIVYIDGCSADGTDCSISRTAEEISAFQSSIANIVSPRERASLTWLFYDSLGILDTTRRTNPTLLIDAGRYFQALISSTNIVTSSEYLKFFTPWEHDLMGGQPEVSGQEPSERNENEEEDRSNESDSS